MSQPLPKEGQQLWAFRKCPWTSSVMPTGDSSPGTCPRNPQVLRLGVTWATALLSPA